MISSCLTCNAIYLPCPHGEIYRAIARQKHERRTLFCTGILYVSVMIWVVLLLVAPVESLKPVILVPGALASKIEVKFF